MSHSFERKPRYHDTIVEFLLARFAEDEKRWTNPAFVRLSGPWLSDLVVKMGTECEVKRRIVNEIEIIRKQKFATPGTSNLGLNYSLDLILRLLTLPYVDHPDYDTSWGDI